MKKSHTEATKGAKVKKPDKRVVPRAASFKRIAKVLRIRAANYRSAASIKRKESRARTQKFHLQEMERAQELDQRAAVLRDIAVEFDNEAATLRSQR